MVPSSEQRSRVLILVNSCVHILYGISTIILVSFAVGLISNETHADNGIQKNWETNMIVDIQSSRYDSCPQGYEPMFSFNWPGTVPACNCQLWNDSPTRPHGPDGEFAQLGMTPHDLTSLSKESSENSKESKKKVVSQNGNEQELMKGVEELGEEQTVEKKTGEGEFSDIKKLIQHNRKNKQKSRQDFEYVSKETKDDVLERLARFGQENKVYTDGVCNWNQTQAGCQDITPNKPQAFTKWKQRLQWCVARAQAVSMSTMQKYYDAESGTCKDENLRVCGDPDDKNFQFCFPKQYTQCPINGILISTTPPRGQESLYYVSRPMQFSRNQQLYVSRNLPQQMPISNFVVSEDGVCIPETNSNISQDHQDYFLLNKYRKRCSNSTDDRYLQLDLQGEQSFYYNNFALSYRDILPSFTLNNTYAYSLYKHNYIFWKHECAENMGYFLSDNDFDQFYTREKALKIITYLISIITVLLSVFELLLICKIPFVLGIEKYLLQWDPMVIIILQLIVLPFCAAALHQSIVLTNIESQLQTKQCTDDFTLKLIGAGSVQIHQKIQNFNKGQIIFICLLLLTNAVNFLLTLCCAASPNAPKKKRRASTY